MTEPNFDAVNEAIKKMFAEATNGGFLTDFVLSCAGVASDGDVNDFVFHESESSLHALYGLSKMGVKHLERYIDSDFGDDAGTD